jgi:hypothetical protein
MVLDGLFEFFTNSCASSAELLLIKETRQHYPDQ